jgi:transcriptional regulator with XRE-family HTH domain
LTQGHCLCYQCPTLAAKTTERAKIIAARVVRARDDAKLNNSSLAIATGLPRRTIVRITGGHNEPDTDTLERIANATRKPLSFFQVDRPRPDLSAAVESLVDVLVDEVRAKLIEKTNQLSGVSS